MNNRAYKDTVFRDLFGAEENKANALELYNALNGTRYEDPEELRITTLDNTIFIGMRNDVSFLLRQDMFLVEHQSTQNPNMPLRGFFYLHELYAELIGDDRRPLYNEQALELPTPRFYVLYNGEKEMPDRVEQRLSDTMEGGPGDLEVVAHILNVNEGRNREIMEAGKTLAGYAHLMAMVREGRRSMPLKSAIDDAIDCCIKEGVLVEYLKSKRGTLREMLFQEYDEEYARQVARDDGYVAGREEGRTEGREEGRAEERERLIARLREAGVDEGLIQQAVENA